MKKAFDRFPFHAKFLLVITSCFITCCTCNVSFKSASFSVPPSRKSSSPAKNEIPFPPGKRRGGTFEINNLPASPAFLYPQPESRLYQETYFVQHKDNDIVLAPSSFGVPHIRGGGAPNSDRRNAQPKDSLEAGTREVLTQLGRFSKLVWKRTLQPVFQDPDAFIFQPLKTFFLDDSTVDVDFDFLTSHCKLNKIQNRTAEAFQPTLSAAKCGFLLRPKRIVRLIVVAWLLTEGLSLVGSLAQNDEVKDRFVRVWTQHAQPKVQKAKQVTLNWIKEQQASFQAAKFDWKRLHTWPPKYQFATGVAMGMLISPAAVALTIACIQLGSTAYLCGELNDYAKQESDTWRRRVDRWYEKVASKAIVEDSSSSLSTETLLTSIDQALESWRSTVRSTVQQPDQFFTASRKALNRIFFSATADSKKSRTSDNSVGRDQGTPGPDIFSRSVINDDQDDEEYEIMFRFNLPSLKEKHGSLPIKLQRGLLVGLVLGFLSGA